MNIKFRRQTTLLISLQLIFNLCFSQNLTFQDLKFTLEHNIEEADNYISKKGFLFHKTENTNNADCQKMIWSFKRNTDNNYANAFISKYCFTANSGLILYQFGARNTFDNIKSYCKNSGFIQTLTETDNLGALCTTYESANFKMEFCSGLNKGTNKNEYTIKLSVKAKTQVVVTGNKIESSQKCKIVGLLQRELFYGPPGFGEDTLNDKKEYSFILKLQKPISFKDSEFGSGAWEPISKIHVLELNDNIDLSNYVNKNVTITCTLTKAHTGHHHAPAITWDLYDVKLNDKPGN
jgi:hypothetical protein